jgi:hypothetical protein
MNALGTQEAEAEREKGKKVATKVQADFLPRHYAQVVYWSIYLPGMGYSLPVTTLSEDELKHLQCKPVQTILPAMGYNRNMPKAVGPREYAGIAFRRLYIEQGSQKTAMHMRHYRHGDPLGRAFRIGLQWFPFITAFPLTHLSILIDGFRMQSEDGSCQ